VSAPPEHPPRWSEYLDLESLRPDPRNPKTHDIDLLRASLGRWGYVEPVVVDERTGLLVAGHGRRELLLADLASGAEPPEGVVAEGGRWSLPVQRGWSSVDDDEAGAYLVASNQIGVVGGWDTAALAELLAGVAEGPGLDGVGFGTDDLAAMLAGEEDEPGGGGGPRTTWGVVVEVEDKPAQRGLLVEFASRGLTARAL